MAIEAFFTDAKQLISRKDFLNLIDMHLTINKVSESGQTIKFAENPDKQGYFLAQLPAFLEEGIYQINLTVQGQTFQRQLMHTVGVLKTPLVVETIIDLERGKASIQLIPDRELIDTRLLHIEAVIYENQVERHRVISEHDKQWQLEVNAPVGHEPTRIRFLVRAQSVSGAAITPDLQDLVLTKAIFTAVLTPVAAVDTMIEEEKIVDTAAVTQEENDLEAELSESEEQEDLFQDNDEKDHGRILW